MTLEKAKQIIEQLTGKTVTIEECVTDFMNGHSSKNLVVDGVQLFTPLQLRTLDNNDVMRAIDYINN